jgi:hypothetical protein
MIKLPGPSRTETQPAITNVVSVQNTSFTHLNGSGPPPRSVRLPDKPPLALADEVHIEQLSQNNGDNYQTGHPASAGLNVVI